MPSNESKVVAVDNWARETIADRLIVENVHFKDLADFYASEVNASLVVNGDFFFEVYKQDDRLSRGMEDLI